MFSLASAALADPRMMRMDVVQMVERDLVADQDVFALASFAQLVERARRTTSTPVLDEELDQRMRPSSRGCPATMGQQIMPKDSCICVYLKDC